jgi:hypothetical protein
VNLKDFRKQEEDLCKECTRPTLRQSVESLKSSEGSVERKECERTLIQVLGERFPRGHTIRLRLGGESSASLHRRAYARSAEGRDSLSPRLWEKRKHALTLHRSVEQKPRLSRQPCKRRFKGQPFEKFEESFIGEKFA